MGYKQKDSGLYSRTVCAGFSLLEVLIALSLLSFSLIAVMQAQRVAYQKMRKVEISNQVVVAQLSLAERLRSCSGSQDCQNLETDRWYRQMKIEFPQLKTHVTRNGTSYESSLVMDADKKEKTTWTLQFRP